MSISRGSNAFTGGHDVAVPPSGAETAGPVRGYGVGAWSWARVPECRERQRRRCGAVRGASTRCRRYRLRYRLRRRPWHPAGDPVLHLVRHCGTTTSGFRSPAEVTLTSRRRIGRADGEHRHRKLDNPRRACQRQGPPGLPTMAARSAVLGWVVDHPRRCGDPATPVAEVPTGGTGRYRRRVRPAGRHTDGGDGAVGLDRSALSGVRRYRDDPAVAGILSHLEPRWLPDRHAARPCRWLTGLRLGPGHTTAEWSGNRPGTRSRTRPGCRRARCSAGF